MTNTAVTHTQVVPNGPWDCVVGKTLIHVETRHDNPIGAGIHICSVSKSKPEYAAALVDAPAMRLALDLIAAGVATAESGVFTLYDKFPCGVARITDTWTATINAIGWPRCVDALSAARGGV